MKNTKRRGVILVTALVVVFVMALWVVAALARTRFQSGEILFGQGKSETYFLAKRAISRSLFFIQNDPGWVSAHSSKAQADTTTDNALCWAEEVAGQVTLKCEAKIGSQTGKLSVPLLKLDSDDTQIYSVSPAGGSGKDVVAWTTAQTTEWKTLPAIPGNVAITAVTSTSMGDVFAAVNDGGTSKLWRYRPGRGWVQMPDLPSGVGLKSLSLGQDTRLVGLGSNNQVLSLSLNSELQWQQIAAPAGETLSSAAVSQSNAEQIVVGTRNATGSKIYQYDKGSADWDSFPTPQAANFNVQNGAFQGQSGPVENFDGGVAIDGDGSIFAASNPTNGPAVIYEFEATVPGATDGTWKPLPLIESYHYDGTGALVNDGYSEKLKDLSVDDDNKLWVQWQSKTDPRFSTLQIDPSGN